MTRALVTGAIVVLLGAAPSSAADRGITIPGKFFDPERLELLAGDTVTWTNLDAVTHTVTADDGSFDSGDLAPDGTFSLTVDRPMRVSFHCTIHRFMTGELEVFALALSGPLDPVTVGAPFKLSGLSAPGTKLVTVEKRRADGEFFDETTATVSADGHFSVAIQAVTSTDYRAVVGTLRSRPVHVAVSPRITLRIRGAGQRVRLEGTATPAQPGMPAVLEVYSRERFDWLRFARVRLDAQSRISIALSPRRKLHLRLVLLRASLGFVGGTSNAVDVAAPRSHH